MSNTQPLQVQQPLVDHRGIVTWNWLQWFNLVNLALFSSSVSTPYSILRLVAYSSNAAAIANGLKPGMLYRTGTDPDLVAVVH